jgi:hypothetical protein
MITLCMGLSHLLMEYICIRVRQLQLEDMNWSYTTMSGRVFIGAKQLLIKYFQLEECD